MKKILSTISRRITNLFVISKRQQFVSVVALLTILLVGTQVFSGGLRMDILLILGISAYGLSAIVLREDLRGWEFITLLILPAYYTVAVFLFYFLLPSRWLTRLPVAMLYAVGMYAILLTENIYNVAAQRNIQLLRAAHGVGFLLTLVTGFFLTDTLLSLHLPYYQNCLISLVIFFPLTLQALWSMQLTQQISFELWISSIIICLMICETVLVLSFWPIRTTMAALLITTEFYTVVGMTQQQLIGRLFAKTAKEYISVFVIVLLLILFTTKWGSGIY